MSMLVNFGTCEKLSPLLAFDKNFPIMIRHYVNNKKVEALVSMGGDWILINCDSSRREVYKYDLEDYTNCDMDMQCFIEARVNIPTGHLCTSVHYKTFMKYKHHFDMVSSDNFEKLERKNAAS